MVSTEINWQGGPVCPKCGSADVQVEPPPVGDRMIVKGEYICASCDFRSATEDDSWFPGSPDDED